MLRIGLLAALVACASSAPLAAASLQVQPALIDVTAPGAASTLTLRNEGQAPVNVQVRVFRWSQSNGEEKLEPTEDVVASPPAVTLAPGTDYIARVVRVAKQPVTGEEAYRLFIDEIPSGSQLKVNTVKLLIRHSIPVFFASPERTQPVVEWAVVRRGDRIVLSAQNRGSSRLRISALSLRDQGGNTVSLGGGLVGYALGSSTMRWVAPGSARGFASSGSVSISGQGNDGPIRATAPIRSER